MMNTSLAYLMKKAKTVGDPGLVTRPSTVMPSTKLMDFAHKVQQLDGEIRDNPVHSSGKGPFLYYVRVKGWVGGIAKYLLFLTKVGGWF